MSTTASRDFRKASFKNRGINSDEVRRRREEATVEIRKQKREDMLYKRRNVLADEMNFEDDSLEVLSSNSLPLIQQLAVHKQGIYSQNPDEVLENVKAFRKILSQGNGAPLNEVIECGVMPRFVELLTIPLASVPEPMLQKYTSIQFEACWSLTNISYGDADQTKAVVEAGAVAPLVALLSSPSQEVRDQAIWTLGNIIGDGAHYRDLMLENQFLLILCDFIRSQIAANAKISLIRNCVWCLSNLCRGKPAVSWGKIEPALSLISDLLFYPDNTVQADACWAVAYLSDGQIERIGNVIAAGFIPRLISLLSNTATEIQSPALRAIGNIVTGDTEQTQLVVDSGALESLRNLLSSSKQSILREACWAISNISAGSVSQVQALIDVKIFGPLVYLLAHSDLRTRKEACWAISNATTHRVAYPEHVRHLVAQGALQALCDFLRVDDPKMLIVTLDALSNILEVGESDSFHYGGPNSYAVRIEEIDGLTKIADLQQHREEEVYDKSKNLLQRFFAVEEDSVVDANADFDVDDYPYAPPQNPPQSGHQFGSMQSSGKFSF